MEFDTVIRGGSILDGTGEPRFRADIGIVGDSIASIGPNLPQGAIEVDADDAFVCPGFIDGHTHLDLQASWDPMGGSSAWHGVTTAVMGNCGFTVAPVRPATVELIIRSIERAEDMSRDTLLSVDWSWESFGEYLDRLEVVPKGLNYAAYVGHTALRTYVMGERAYEGPATAADEASMRLELERALRAGAIGLSTSRTIHHTTAEGGRIATGLGSWSEVQGLVRAMGEAGGGVFQLAVDYGINEDEAEVATSVLNERLCSMALESGCLVTFMAVSGEQLFTFLQRANQRGARVIGQVHAREFQSIYGFKVRLPFDHLPEWKELRRRPLAGQRAALLDDRLRARLVDEALTGEYSATRGFEARPPDYERMRILDRAEGPYHTVAQRARERGVTPVDIIIDLSLASDFERFFGQPGGNFDHDLVLGGIRHPRAVIAASDSGAHVSQIMDSSIPTHVLAHWVRREEALTWEEAVRLLTSVPAAVWGFADRGVLREGMRADVLVFDPAEIGPGLPTALDDLPGGGVRLFQRATGLRATLVNGRAVLRDGHATGEVPGRLLRAPAG